MDLGSLGQQAQDAAKSLLGDEAKTDAALDAVADAAKKVTGGRFDGQIDAARDTVDGKLGE
ncbi:Rv0909 family putative TA system antitoxin [Schaalia suimastitidis]|uniref:Rv0909 family putative TA system antitoxin n=1 Tax=Schaalia suimastitidis TaxID=121163 RepID=UPI00041A848E|nr:Rv0909 family putative TA system antitoxin [Schaalia suimastitidis]